MSPKFLCDIQLSFLSGGMQEDTVTACRATDVSYAVRARPQKSLPPYQMPERIFVILILRAIR